MQTRQGVLFLVKKTEKMRNRILFFMILLILLIFPYLSEAEIILREDNAIQEVLEKKQKDYSGYRIQVFSGGAGDRVKAEEIKNTVEEKYENVKTYISYQSNTFRVRVGDFLSKLDAVPLKYKLKKMYPSCYIVKEKEIFLGSKRDTIQNIPKVREQDIIAN